MRGVLAAFSTEAALEAASASLREHGIEGIDTYTPKALEADESGAGSPIPLLIFVAGIIGASAMYMLETYSDVVNWPVNIGGRPAFSWPAFVPIAFEIGVLFAATTGFISFLVINRFPTLWAPVDECAAMRQAMRAEWLVAVTPVDSDQLARARRLLEAAHPISIEEIAPELAEVPA
jgi:Protein of unknown function (DUF3341)